MEQGVVSGEQFYFLHLARKLSGVNLPSPGFMVFAALVMGAIACWVILRNRISSEHDLKAAMVLATASTVLFAPHYSWYFAWLVPFLCFTPRLAVFYLTVAGFLLYLTWLGDSPDEMFFMKSLIYLPALLIAAVELVWRGKIDLNFPVQSLSPQTTTETQTPRRLHRDR